jgi:hypothetical protein
MKLFSVVLEVAAYAILAIRISHLQPGVISVIRCAPLRHFLVTIEALESRCAGGELMATRALRGPTEGLMGLGERAGRNLGQDGMSGDQ